MLAPEENWSLETSSVLPLCPFGSVFYFQCLINGAVIDPYENYLKQSFRNRYQVISSQGMLTLQVPVAGQKGEKIPTSEIRVYDQLWQRRHLQSLRSSYGASPFFIHYFDDLEALFSKEYDLLMDFSLATHQLAKTWLADLSIEIVENYVEKDSKGQDLRPFFKPSKMEVIQTRYQQAFSDRMPFLSNLSIVDLVMHLGPEASHYIRQTPEKVILH